MANAASPFAPLNLAHHDANYLRELVHVFVQHQVESYERYLHDDHERLDNKRWKQVLQRDNMRVLSELEGTNPADDLGYVNQQQSAELADLPALLTVGQMEGSLDDAIQRNHSAVDLYCRASVNSGGRVARSIGVKYAAVSLISARKMIRCAHLKKLTWLLRVRDSSTIIRGEAKCIGCGQKPGIFATEIGSCSLCKRALCSSCRLKVELGFASSNGSFFKKKMWFCTYCVDEAARTSSRTVACGEYADSRIVQRTPWSSGPTNSSSPSGSERSDDWGSLDKRYLNLMPR
ncbi:hypothetical protein PC119_g5997 [Phytophthora cactorum]|uniref:FYVE-type domain-containing protein n=1 Tax=Phytophthora cactorum TaxID=29920 RepID=A0A8T1D8T0_9STRA|nr:hypothetical protein PC111_g9194 [Phytophthora cactorum]KAG2937288.1 hypothetical protein PC117_g11754 [Phytophthora cactorum]KAG3031221.1 hypothetical protein PC119_g5997 [Phytophthora cactorum]